MSVRAQGADAPLLVIAAGGTGGHMFPAQALAEAMLARGWRVRLSTDARGARYTGAFPEAVEITQVASATFARGGALAKLAVPFRILGGVAMAKWRFLWDRPTVVVGFGGYPSIPALAAAWALRLPRMIHEQNGVLGRVNRVFAPRVHKVACGTWPTSLPKGVSAEYTGNPVRASIRAVAGAPYPCGGAVRILVVGGSQGASVMRVVPQAIALLSDFTRDLLDVSQQARDADAEAVRDAYARLGVSCEVQPFFDDMPRRLSAAHLVISRAGASSVADISVVGRPAILIPYAAATADHQTANARGLEEAGAALVIQERDLTAEVLSTAIERILATPDTAQEMAAAALSVGRPDATERLVALVENLADRPAASGAAQDTPTGDSR